MITISNLDSVRNADKSLFFMTKAGCSNCKQVKPMIEKFEAENPDILVFTHEATAQDDPILVQFPQIRVFPGVFCLKSGKVVSQTNAIPNPESFSIGFATLEQKYMNYGVSTRRIAQAEAQIKMLKDFHAFLDETITFEELEVKSEDFILPNETATTKPVEHCEPCE